MRTIDKIITKVDGRRGAPMGRSNVYPEQYSINIAHKFILVRICDTEPTRKKAIRLYDCRVPMCPDGAYDKGGAYWGIGNELRVRYTKDLSFVEFYRVEPKNNTK